MTNNFLFGISLTGSFFAGVLALFAPCCITFLLPAYLGTIFKKTEKVIFYTIIFALGLATVLVPVALGFKYLVSFFDRFHNAFYYLGALLLVFLGIMTFLEIKMPFVLRLSQKPKEKVDLVSIYALGIISGLTSSCCAPVLFAAITLTSLSPTMLQAVFVSLAYVFGIVFPLFLLSFVYDTISAKALSKAKHRVYKILKILAAVIFIGSGLVIAVLNYQGKIVMGAEADNNYLLRVAIYQMSKYFQNPLVDLLMFVGLLYGFYFLLTSKKAFKLEKDLVCGMMVDPQKTEFKKKAGGTTYYFCSKHCLQEFKALKRKRA